LPYPVDEVEVVVVDELGGVEDALGRGGDVPERLLALHGRAAGGVHAARRVLHPGGGLRRLEVGGRERDEFETSCGDVAAAERND
jgi:hypothetical protein